MGIVGIVVGALVFLIGVVDIANVANVPDERFFDVTVETSAGVGLYLTALAGLVAVGAGIWTLVQRRPNRPSG